MRVIAFTGMPGAGKSVAVEAAKELDVPVARMGDAVWAEVRARGLPLTEQIVGTVAGEMRSRKGPGVWAERTLEMLRETEADLAIIDGVRAIEEVEVFRDALGTDFFVVAVHASRDLRFARLMQRGRADDVKTRQEFEARDSRELGWGIGKVIALSDVVLVNHGDVGTLKEQVRDLLKRARESSVSG